MAGRNTVERHEATVERRAARRLAKSRHAPAATVPADKDLYQRQIEATDRQIDALVYELYGLTEEEVGVVQATDRSR